METNGSVARKEKLAKIDDMLLQLIQEVEECRNTVTNKVRSYREEYFDALCRDVINAKR